MSRVLLTTLGSLGFGFHPLSPDLTPENVSASEIIKEIMDPRRGVERLLRKYLFETARPTWPLGLPRAVVSACAGVTKRLC
jgi:hypothetical protein